MPAGSPESCHPEPLHPPHQWSGGQFFQFLIVLLHSCPDTVQRFPLRKTKTSTPLTRGSFTVKHPGQNITPALAACRYRAPLTPRLCGLVKYTWKPWFCQVFPPFSLLPEQSLLLSAAASGICCLRCKNTIRKEEGRQSTAYERAISSPSMNRRFTPPSYSSGSPSQITRSASFPGSRVPTLEEIPMHSAG